MFVTKHHALDAATQEHIVLELQDRVEILDALHRFGLGQDLRNLEGATELFASAFTHDAVLDFRDAAEKCGLPIPLMSGRDVIVATILNPQTRIDTSHVVSNARVTVDGDRGHLSAIVEAQHLPSGDHSRHALLKNIYDVQLVRDGARWVMQHVYIDCLWYTGDPMVILGQYQPDGWTQQETETSTQIGGECPFCRGCPEFRGTSVAAR